MNKNHAIFLRTSEKEMEGKIDEIENLCTRKNAFVNQNKKH